MERKEEKIVIKDSPYVAGLEKSTERFAEILSGLADKYNLKEILDLGTGSGYVAIKLAKEGKAVDASDISDEAVALAAENAQANHARVNFIKSDLFNNIRNVYGLISFNPPCGKAGKSGMFIRNILKGMPSCEILTFSLGYFLYRRFRLELIVRFLKECRRNLKDRGLIALKLINMELPSMAALLKKEGFQVIEKHPVTGMSSALVAREQN